MLSPDHPLHLQHHLQQQLLDRYSLIRKAMLSLDLLQQQKPLPLAMVVLLVSKVTPRLGGRTGGPSSDTTVDSSRVISHHTDMEHVRTSTSSPTSPGPGRG